MSLDGIVLCLKENKFVWVKLNKWMKIWSLDGDESRFTLRWSWWVNEVDFSKSPFNDYQLNQWEKRRNRKFNYVRFHQFLLFHYSSHWRREKFVYMCSDLERTNLHKRSLHCCLVRQWKSSSLEQFDKNKSNSIDWILMMKLTLLLILQKKGNDRDKVNKQKSQSSRFNRSLIVGFDEKFTGKTMFITWRFVGFWNKFDEEKMILSKMSLIRASFIWFFFFE